jgi:hypothetical protein
MPSHEEGEFELVLGNKQLLSVFFLVILLLGVFFSMGYIVGRNTAPATTLSASNSRPIVVEPASGAPPTPPPDPTKPSALLPNPDPPKADPPKPDPKKADPPKVTAKADPPKVEQPKVEPPKPKPEPPKPTPPVATGGSGTYLQVVATKRSDGEKVVAGLVQKGFPASMRPVPDSDLVRVVVGPLADAAAVTKTRGGLEGAGFKPIIRKF